MATATAATPAVGGLAGCLDTGGADCSDPWSPGISGEEPTLSPGETGSIRVEVERTTGLTLGVPALPGEGVAVEVDVGSATVTPSPDVQLDTYPPQWYWERCTAVSVDVPVRVAADAEPGEYTYTVTATQHREGGDSVDRAFTITVVGD